MEARIRSYDPARDAAAVRECFVGLQDEEHEMAPTSPRGEEIADDYLAWMHQRVAKSEGRIWVAEDGGRVVGFVCALARVERTDPDDGDPVHGLVGEIFVRAEHRSRGLGARLLAVAEAHVRAHGAPVVRLAHHGRNDAAHRFYRREGYEPVMVLMGKRLG